VYTRLIAVLLVAAKAQEACQLKSVIVECTTRHNQQSFVAHCDQETDHTTIIYGYDEWPIRVEVHNGYKCSTFYWV